MLAPALDGRDQARAGAVVTPGRDVRCAAATSAARERSRVLQRRHRGRARDGEGVIVRTSDAWTIDDAMKFADDLIDDRLSRGQEPSASSWSGCSAVDVHADAAAGVEALARAQPLEQLGDHRRDLRIRSSARCCSRIRSLSAQVAGWSRDRNMWVRRASAVSLIPSVRQGRAARRRPTRLRRRCTPTRRI